MSNPLDPIAMLGLIDGIPERLRRMVDELEEEIKAINHAWEGIGKVGGQREDHAASLMCRMSFHFRTIITYCKTCSTQIDQMKHDPFGRNE